MIVVAVDDEPILLKEILTMLEENKRVTKAVGFNDAKEALAWFRNNKAEAAFLDIEMYELNGLALAKEIKEIQKDVSIVFLTGYPQYALDAYKIHAMGYLVKPTCPEDVETELAYIEEHCVETEVSEKNIRVQTFGGFEVFYKGEALKFKRNISKEIFAYLIDRRGASVTMGELELISSEYGISERSAKSLIRTAIAELRSLFRQIGEEDIIVKERNSIRIQPDKIACDFYDFLNGRITTINSYMGDYMINYSWAEFTTAMLLNNKLFTK